MHNIVRGQFNSGAGVELALLGSRATIFTDENFNFKSKIKFKFYATRRTLVNLGGTAWRYLVYSHLDHVSLLSLDENLQWRYNSDKKATLYVSGVASGDMDGDSKPEFAVYHSFTKGVVLLDATGVKIWEHPVQNLEHLEVADLNGDSKAEIIYSGFGTADSVFTVLDGAGLVIDKVKVPSKSRYFTIVNWPDRSSRPNLLITEDGKMIVANLKGETIAELNAPGCKGQFESQAVPVKFKDNEPDYLAVKKTVFPDLSVLYVYDSKGQLVYQTTKVTETQLPPLVFVVPVGSGGTEKLLVGAETKDGKAVLLEYAPRVGEGSAN